MTWKPIRPKQLIESNYIKNPNILQKLNTTTTKECNKLEEFKLFKRIYRIQ